MIREPKLSLYRRFLNWETETMIRLGEAVLRVARWVRRIRILYRKVIRGADGSAYLWRLTLLQLPSGASVKLHRFLRSDWSRDLHDHPWPFSSLILWPGYYEVTACVLCRGTGKFGARQPLGGQCVACVGCGEIRRWLGPLTFRSVPAEHRHRVELPWDQRRRRPRRCWTLFFTGAYCREWGFLTACGWQHWREYWNKVVAGDPICED